MKKVKVLLLSVLTLALFVGSATPIGAATYNYSSKGKSFKKAWSTMPINTADRTMKYGYNTLFINEDYTHTFHKSKAHYAYVKNSGSAYEKPGSKGKYAKAEIRHHSGTVFYRYRY